MAENLNTLYYSIGLDDREMQEGLKKAIQNLASLDDEFNKINDNISKTFGKKIQSSPIHNEIKGLKGELQDLEKQWGALSVAERRGAQGTELRAKYDGLRKDAGSLNNTLGKLYTESQRAAAGQSGLASQLGMVNKELTLQGRLASNVKTLFTTFVSVFAVKSFIQNLAQVRGEFELQQVSLRAIIRDAEAADKIFSQIKSFSVVSPFEFKDLIGYAKQLSAFQIPVNELFDTTKRLADVSAGLGVGMDRITLAYGQIRAAGVLRGCLGFDTEIITSEGIEKVQDIKVGDKLPTDASIPNNVIDLIRGREQMYLIKQEGTNYRVNENHILTLSRNGKVVDVCLKNIKDNYSEYLGVKFINGEYATYPIEIIKDKIDDYYGFVLDGNKRFLLRDNTLTHNTELRQLTEAGIPAVDELAKKFSELEGRVVSAGDVFEKISNRMVSFGMVKEIFADLTDEGGMFYMMQEKQAESLKGKIANLADAYAIMLNDIGEANDGILKGGVEGIASLMNNWQLLWGILKSLIASYGAYKTAILLAAVAQGAFNKSNIAGTAIQTGFNASIAKGIISLKGLSLALKANPIGIALSAITAVVGMMWSYSEANDRAKKEIEELTLQTSKEQATVNGLIDSLKDYNTQGKDRETILRKIGQANSELEKNIRKESEAIEDQSGKLQRLIEIQLEYNKSKDAERLVQRFSINSGLNEAVKQLGDAQSQLKTRQTEITADYYDFVNRLNIVMSEGFTIDLGGGKQKTMQFNESQKQSLNEIVNSTQAAYDKMLAINRFYYTEKNKLGSEANNREFAYLRQFYDYAFDAVNIDNYTSKQKNLAESQQEYNHSIVDMTNKMKAYFTDTYGDIGKLSVQQKREISNTINALNEIPDVTKKQLILSLGVKVSDEEVKASYTNLQSSVEKIYKDFADKNKKMSFELGAVIPKEDDTSAAYFDLQRNEYKKVTEEILNYNNAKEKGLTIYDEETIVAKKLQQEWIKYNATRLGFSLETTKGGGKPKDPRIEALENQIKLIEEAQKAYEKLNKYMGKEKTGESLSPIYKSVSFKPDEKGNVDFGAQIQNKIGSLMAISKDAGQKAQESFDKGIRGEKSDALADNIKESLNAITKQIDSYKGKYDLYNQLLGLGETKEKSIDIAFGVNFVGDVDIIKYLQDKIQKAVGEGVKLDLTTDIVSKDFGEVFKGLEIPEEQKKSVEKFFDMLKKQFIDFQTEASKAKQSLDDMVAGLESKDFNLFGKGFELDISKIARDTANAYAEIDKREKEKTEELSKFKDDKDKELYEEQLKRLRILGDKEKESIRKQSQEKLNDLAGKVINEGLDDKGLKGIFDNLSEASFKQLNQLKKYFKEIGENGIVISTDEAEASLNKVELSIDNLKGLTMDEIVLKLNDTSLSETEKQAISLYMQLKNGKLSAEEFDAALKKISTEKLGKTKEQKLQSISEIATQAAQSVGQLGDSLYNLGESSGNESLMNIGDALSSFATFAEAATDITMGILSGNPADVIKGVFNIAIQFIEAEARHQKALAELAKSKVAQQRQYNLLLLEQNLLFEEGTNIFGTDQIGKAINAIGVYREAIAGLAEEMQGDKGKPKMSMIERLTGDSLGSFKKKTDAYNKGISALYNAQVVTGHKKTGLFGWGKGKDTYSGLLDVYPDLIDGENKLNKERAQSILDTQKMDEGTRTLLESLLKLQNQADEAYKEMQSVLQETFGVLGNDLSNSIVDAFVNGTDAAESFRQSVGTILEDLAKQIMYSLFLKNKFDKLQKDLEGIYATEGISDKQIGSEVTKLLGGFFSGIGSTIDESTKFLEEFQKQAAASGFDIFQGQAGKGLSEGIKSVTEDTAQLLVSYMNAIRGSVLFQELYMKNIDMNVAGIYQAMGGSPNITTINTIPPEIIAAISEPLRINNDFLRSIDLNIGNMHSIAANSLAQLVMIQANTFNIAMEAKRSSDAILSVIAPGHPKGGNAFRVWA